MTSQANWLELATPLQRSTLVRLLATAPLSRHEQANKMLVAPPEPIDSDDAAARCAEVIEVLESGL